MSAFGRKRTLANVRFRPIALIQIGKQIHQKQTPPKRGLCECRYGLRGLFPGLRLSGHVPLLLCRLGLGLRVPVLGEFEINRALSLLLNVGMQDLTFFRDPMDLSIRLGAWDDHGPSACACAPAAARTTTRPSRWRE